MERTLTISVTEEDAIRADEWVNQINRGDRGVNCILGQSLQRMFPNQEDIFVGEDYARIGEVVYCLSGDARRIVRMFDAKTSYLAGRSGNETISRQFIGIAVHMFIKEN